MPQFLTESIANFFAWFGGVLTLILTALLPFLLKRIFDERNSILGLKRNHVHICYLCPSVPLDEVEIIIQSKPCYECVEIKKRLPLLIRRRRVYILASNGFKKKNTGKPIFSNRVKLERGELSFHEHFEKFLDQWLNTCPQVNECGNRIEQMTRMKQESEHGRETKESTGIQNDGRVDSHKRR